MAGWLLAGKRSKRESVSFPFLPFFLSFFLLFSHLSLFVFLFSSRPFSSYYYFIFLLLFFLFFMQIIDGVAMKERNRRNELVEVELGLELDL